MAAEKSKLIAFLLSPRWSEGWHPRRLGACAVLCLNIPGRCESYVRRRVSMALFMFWLAGYCCQILTKVEFSRQIFDKTSTFKFHENPPSGSGVVPCGRTDGRTDGETHDEANSRFLRFHQRA